VIIRGGHLKQSLFYDTQIIGRYKMLELWPGHKMGIIIGLAVIGLLCLFLAAAFALEVLIKTSNADKYTALGTILAAIATIIAAIGGIAAFFFVGYQAVKLGESVNLQREEFSLEHRPYLYTELKLTNQPLSLKINGKFAQVNLEGIWRNEKENAYFGGGDLYFRNVGKDPATITKTEYRVRSDARRDLDFVQWFKEAYGGFPDITSVMPNQQNLRVPCHPIVSLTAEAPKLLFVGAVISYVGPQKETEKQRKYWYKFSQLFVVELTAHQINGQKIIIPVLHPHVMYTDWDRNEGKDPPPLEDPNWDDLLKKSYVKTLTDSNR
jgi:hypothetical protein